VRSGSVPLLPLSWWGRRGVITEHFACVASRLAIGASGERQIHNKCLKCCLAAQRAEREREREREERGAGGGVARPLAASGRPGCFTLPCTVRPTWCLPVPQHAAQTAPLAPHCSDGRRDAMANHCSPRPGPPLCLSHCLHLAGWRQQPSACTGHSLPPSGRPAAHVRRTATTQSEARPGEPYRTGQHPRYHRTRSTPPTRTLWYGGKYIRKCPRRKTTSTLCKSCIGAS